MTTRRRHVAVDGQLPLIEGSGLEYGAFRPFDPGEISPTSEIQGPCGPLNTVVDLPTRNRALRDFLHFYNRSQKGKGIATAEASHPALDEVERDYEHGVAGVQARHGINQERARKNLERACRVCPYAGECALRSRFGAMVKPENLGKGTERAKFEKILDKDPAQQCEETLETIKLRRKK